MAAVIPILEPLLGAFGDLLNDFGGLRQTRLRSPVAPGDTVLPLERVLGLPPQGLLLLDGTLYHYDAADTAGRTVTGLYTLQLGQRVDGATMPHQALAGVTDMSRTYSQLDALRNSYFIETAQGDDLAVCGRNYGLGRDPSISSDATYRKALLAIAFGPRGTMYGLQTALDAMLGPGQYTLREDTQTYPCQVFISTARSTLLSQTTLGRTYLAAPQHAVAQGQDIQLDPATLSVTGVYRDGVDLVADCGVQRPSAATPAWAYAGDPENNAVQIASVNGGAQACQLGGATAYALPSRLNGPGKAYFAAVARPVALGTVPSAASDAFVLSVGNGKRLFRLGLKSQNGGLGIVLMDQTYAVVGTMAGSFDAVQFHELGLRLHADGRVEGSVDGAVRIVARETSFAASSDDYLTITTSGNGGVWQLLRLYAKTSDPTDYLNVRASDGTTAAANPRELSSAAAAFVPTDVGKMVAMASGRYQIATVDSAQSVTLTRGTFTGARAGGDPANPSRLTAADAIFEYPSDIGRQVVIDAGSNAGTYKVAAVLGPNNARLTLPYPAQSASALLARPDGSSITLQTQADLTFQLLPTFQDASGIAFELVGASGPATGQPPTIGLRQALPDTDSTYSVRSSTTLGGQLLDTNLPAAFQTDDGPPVLFSAYPFYVSETFAFVRNYLSRLTAAGVRPVLDVQ